MFHQRCGRRRLPDYFCVPDLEGGRGESSTLETHQLLEGLELGSSHGSRHTPRTIYKLFTIEKNGTTGSFLGDLSTVDCRLSGCGPPDLTL